MSGLNQEKAFLREAAQRLEDYLISDALFGGISLPGGGQKSAALSRLTLGNLLLVQARLHAGQPASSTFGDELTRLDGQVESAHQRWAAHWDQKVQQELPVRLQLWGTYLGEYWGDRSANARIYPAQVRERVILTLLAAEMPELPGEFQARLDPIDKRLKSDLQPGAFIWETELAGGFPAEPYWYLYGQLRLE